MPSCISELTWCFEYVFLMKFTPGGSAVSWDVMWVCWGCQLDSGRYDSKNCLFLLLQALFIPVVLWNSCSKCRVQMWLSKEMPKMSSKQMSEIVAVQESLCAYGALVQRLSSFSCLLRIQDFLQDVTNVCPWLCNSLSPYKSKRSASQGDQRETSQTDTLQLQPLPSNRFESILDISDLSLNRFNQCSGSWQFDIEMQHDSSQSQVEFTNKKNMWNAFFLRYIELYAEQEHDITAFDSSMLPCCPSQPAMPFASISV